jgi:hypothetical protein
LNPGKGALQGATMIGASLGGTLGALQDATMIGAVHGHVDRSTLQRIVGRH